MYSKSSKRKKDKSKKIEQIKQPEPRIALIGFRGVGKSSICKNLLSIWESKLIHLDERLEKKHKLSIEKIVETHGWGFFREEESLLLKEVTENDPPPLLIDTGGGILEGSGQNKNEQNAGILKEKIFTIYLYMPKELILARLEGLQKKSHRPLFPEPIDQVFDRREPWYQEVASSVIDVSDASIDDIIRRITKIF